jgi:poly-beta-1,6-N-acetyl-D-glucosamine synthase
MLGLSLLNRKGSLIFLSILYIITGLIFYLALVKSYEPIDSISAIRFLILLFFAPVIIKYILHLFLAPWYPVVESIRGKKEQYAPSVSVLIPSCNEEVGIRNTIRSVIETDYPNAEIIIVNDGSIDKTHDVVTTFIEEFHKTCNNNGMSIVYEKLTNGGKARALNVGRLLARGEIIITIDADSVMDKNTIRNLVKHFSNPRVASVAGNVAIGNRKNPIGFIQQLEYLYGFYFKRAEAIMNAVYIVGGAAAAYRSDILQKVGGFDESTITEDIELSTRLQYEGYHVRYAADAIVYTEGPSSFKGLCKQRLRWKFGRLQTFFRYRRLFFSLCKRHNKYLSFVVLPIALFAEALLFFEGVLLTIFYSYTFMTNDFGPLVFFILLLTGVIGIQIISDTNTRYHKNLLLIAPVAWLLFYIIDFVEYQALMKSVWRFITKQEVAWQSWSRIGVFGPVEK